MKRLTAIMGIILGLGLAVAVYALPNVATTNNERSVATAQITNNSTLSKATFAGGCFWCVEAAFENVPGVAEVISGYSGGEEDSPTYQQVASGSTGHTEAVEVYYDASVVSYEGLLETLWRTANPTDITGQYVDRGQQYRPEIFFHDESQMLAATLSKQNLSDSGRYDAPVAIAITPATAFYAAEDYHQDYYKKNPVRYKLYTRNSGRYQFIDSVWTEGRDINYANFQPDESQVMGKSKESSAMNDTTADMESVRPFNGNAFVKPSDRELKEKLSSIEYKVTQKDGTERAFSSSMHDEKRVGLYVDVVSGEPLFSSSDKFDSGAGWPSFDRPIATDVVIEKSDRSLFGVRTEIRSALADSHLGHVFTDGPASTGNRYCMNAAAMRFVPLESMAEAGYGDFIARVTGGST